MAAVALRSVPGRPPEDTACSSGGVSVSGPVMSGLPTVRPLGARVGLASDHQPVRRQGAALGHRSLVGLDALLASGSIRLGREIGPGNGVLADAEVLPVLPVLRGLLPHGALQRGSVVTTGAWGLLALALAAGPAAGGAWCAAVGLPELGVAAAAGAGIDLDRLLLVPDPGEIWPQVVAPLLDGCDLVLLRPPGRIPAQARRRLEATARRHGTVLLVAGEWDGAQTRLRVTETEWTGIGPGHGRLRARRVRVVAEGRGGSRPRARWLWLPGPDGSVSDAGSPADAGLPEPGWREASAG